MRNDFGTHAQQAESNAAKSNRSVVSERSVPGCRVSTLQHYARSGACGPPALCVEWGCCAAIAYCQFSLLCPRKYSPRPHASRVSPGRGNTEHPRGSVASPASESHEADTVPFRKHLEKRMQTFFAPGPPRVHLCIPPMEIVSRADLATNPPLN
jgi:hypothetical protein